VIAGARGGSWSRKGAGAQWGGWSAAADQVELEGGFCLKEACLKEAKKLERDDSEDEGGRAGIWEHNWLRDGKRGSAEGRSLRGAAGRAGRRLLAGGPTEPRGCCCADSGGVEEQGLFLQDHFLAPFFFPCSLLLSCRSLLGVSSRGARTRMAG
jgi:hypothetical protein